MRRTLTLLLAWCVLLAGCTSIKENDNMGDLPPLPSLAYETGKDARTANPSLYFIDKNTGRLTAEIREMELPYMGDSISLVLGELLKGPVSSGLSPVLRGASLSRVELTGECANVYIETDQELLEKEKFTGAVAISDTVIDYTGAIYVTVFFNGQVMGVDGCAFGPLKKSDGNPDALYLEYKARYAELQEGVSDTVEMSAILYFVDPSGRLLLPEVRTIGVVDGNYVDAVLGALAEGPKYNYDLKTYLSQEKLEQTAREAQGDSDAQQLSIQFDQNIFLEEMSPNRNLEMAGVYYTLAGVLPDTYRLVVKDDRNAYVMTRQVAQKYLGQNIRIALPDAKLKSLISVRRTVKAGYGYDTYIAELMRGPIESDSVTVWPVFPENITMDHVNAISVYENMAVVDFRKAFFEEVNAMSKERQYMLVYSIVNTLAATSNIRAVLFTAEGETVEELSGGLCLSSPLMMNPGIQISY